LHERTGVDFSQYKQSTLKRRILRRMVLNRIDSLPKFVRLVEDSPAEMNALFSDLLINVSNFFRDPKTFVKLKQKVLPRLLKAHPGNSPLRVWVCGCASGEEAYSLAICLVEYLQQVHSHRQVQIFATDISEPCIQRARAGIYPESISLDVSAERLRRFFIKVNSNYQVHKSIRDMCVFARQNVLVDPPFSNLDLLTCRNVLIYFGPALQRRLIPLFHYALRHEGCLLLGNSESIGSTSTEYFNLLDKKQKIYIKRRSPHRPAFEPAPKHHELESKEDRNPTARKQPVEAPTVDLQQQMDKVLLRDFSPGAVVVNANLEVIHFRGRTGDYLEHASGAASLNLLKMVRESLAVGIRTALNRAMRQDIPTKQTGVELRRNKQVREVTIEVVPLRPIVGAERFFLVVFTEEEPVNGRSTHESKARAGQKENREMMRLRRELGVAKESLQSIMEEHEATSEEFKSANEEILSTNEELQSTNEELETAKEELQSTNEELTTLNEELQNRNLELSQVNNDLVNLLASVNAAIIMLGNDLTIRRFTPTAERIFNLIPADMGRSLSDLSSTSLLLPNLETLVQEVIDNLSPIERLAQNRDGHWYQLRIRPYRTRENKLDGAVIMLIDIDEWRRGFEVLLSAVNQPLLLLEGNLRIRAANAAFCTYFGVPVESIQGKPLPEAGEGRWNLPTLITMLQDLVGKNKEVKDQDFEANFPKVGLRSFRVNARRFSEEGRGIQIILLALESLDSKGKE
jgi:two-component system CheB/CheR fusion protein